MNEHENTNQEQLEKDFPMDFMEDFFNSHYIRTRSDNAIIHGFSDAFEQPESTDILINDSGDRHFRLVLNGVDGEQTLTHENPWELMRNEQGIPLLKWDSKNKKIINRTEKEIQAEIESMKPPLENHQKEAIIQTHVILAETLQTPIDHKGRHFSVTMEKQNLLSAQLGLFGLNQQVGIPMELSWNATGEVCEPWEFLELLDLANAMAAYVEPLVQMQREVEVKIKQAKDDREVQSHVERFRKDLQAVLGK